MQVKELFWHFTVSIRLWTRFRFQFRNYINAMRKISYCGGRKDSCNKKKSGRRAIQYHFSGYCISFHD